MRQMWIVGLAFALAFFMAYGEEEGFGGGGGLVGLITLNLSELNAALAAAGFPELPEGLIVTGGGGWGGILSGPVLGGLGFEGTTEALSGELRTSLTLGYGAFTVELARKLGERALLGAGIGLGGGSAELEVRTRFATDFQDALSAPTVTRLNADFFAALLYLRLQFQPLEWLWAEGWAGYLVGLPSRWKEAGRELAGPTFALRAPFVGIYITFGGMGPVEEEEGPVGEGG